MIRIKFRGWDLGREEKYLNDQLKKGWLFQKKSGPIYTFKPISETTSPLFIDLFPNKLTAENEWIKILQIRHLKGFPERVIYYQMASDVPYPAVHEQDPEASLAYYLYLRKKNMVFLNIIPYIAIVNIVLTLFPKFQLLADYSKPVSIFLVVLFLLFVFQRIKINTLVSDYQMKTGDYSSRFRFRMIVRTPYLSKVESEKVMSELAYLGIWNYRFSDQNYSFFYLKSSSNEVDLQYHLQDYFGPGNKEKISVVSPLHLFPLGYW